MCNKRVGWSGEGLPGDRRLMGDSRGNVRETAGKEKKDGRRKRAVAM